MRAAWLALLLSGALPAQAQTEPPPADATPPAAAAEAPTPAEKSEKKEAPPAEKPAAEVKAPATAQAPSETPPAVKKAPAAPPPAEPSRKPAVAREAPAPKPEPKPAAPVPAPQAAPKPQAAVAQDHGRVEPAAAARPATPAPAPLPPPAEPVVAAPAGPALPDTEQVTKQARQLFAYVATGDARAISKMAAYPFQLEGQRLGGPDELLQEWLRQMRGKRTDLLKLEGLEVLTPEQMEQKYGPPPARLSALPWKAPRTFIAVGTLSSHAAVAIFREEGTSWRLVGYHD